MKHRNLVFPHCCFVMLTCSSLVFGGVVSAQSQNMTQSPSMPAQGRDDDSMNRRQLSSFDNFLDSHPELAQQLRKDPSLANNQEFVQNHAELQDYLQQHPEIREQLSQNPNAVMHQERRFDAREDQSPEAQGRGDQGRGDQGRQDQDRDRIANRPEMAAIDRFMDSHPEIAEQVRKDPSLVDNKQFVASHPALQQFLADHPGISEDFKNNPTSLMNREDRYDRLEGQNRGRDATHPELAAMDRFLDRHPEIAEQLRKDPSLVNNKQFVANHTALQQFLTEHPEVREDYRENPNAFMHQEERYDRREDSYMRRDRDDGRGEVASFNEFLGGHNRIASELSKDPSLATNREYLENHPELREYLKANPSVHQELAENPQAFLQSTQQFNAHSTTTTKVGSESKPK
jgi:hypothetical protein